jgi:hypothetical protein
MILLNFSLYKFSRTSLLVISFLVLMLLFHLINCVLFISTYDEVLLLLIRWNGKRYNFDRFSPQVSAGKFFWTWAIGRIQVEILRGGGLVGRVVAFRLHFLFV